VDIPNGDNVRPESRHAVFLLASLKRKLSAERFTRFCELAPKDAKELWEMFVGYRDRHSGLNQYGYVEFADQLLAQSKR
jgi:hypothetical protein